MTTARKPCDLPEFSLENGNKGTNNDYFDNVLCHIEQQFRESNLKEW